MYLLKHIHSYLVIQRTVRWFETPSRSLRCQCNGVKVIDTHIDWTITNRGKSQGSVVGPLLFNIFLGDVVLPLNSQLVNSLRLRRNGHYNADDIFKCMFLNASVWIPNKISLKFVPKGTINNIPALVQIMVWRRPGGKPLSEPMMFSLLGLNELTMLMTTTYTVKVKTLWCCKDISKITDKSGQLVW